MVSLVLGVVLCTKVTRLVLSCVVRDKCRRERFLMFIRMKIAIVRLPWVTLRVLRLVTVPPSTLFARLSILASLLAATFRLGGVPTRRCMTLRSRSCCALATVVPFRRDLVLLSDWICREEGNIRIWPLLWARRVVLLS